MTSYDGDEVKLDNVAIRETAAEVERFNRLTRKVEVVLIALVAVCVIGIAISQYKLANTNKQGVERIISCTTPGMECYEEQQLRSGDLVADVLLQLNQEHLSLKCVLGIPPSQRTGDYQQRCDDQATAETSALRKQLTDEIRRRSDAAKKKQNGG